MQTTSLIQHSVPPPGEVCAACGRAIGPLEQPFIWDQNIVCFGCHRDLSQTPSGRGSDISAGTPERVFFSDSRVHVSRSQVAADGTTYPVAEIHLARLSRTEPRRAKAVGASLLGLITAALGLNRHLDRMDVILLLSGAALVAAGIGVALTRRTRYSILLDVGGSEVCLLTTRKAKHATAIVDAIGEAIVERGQYAAETPPPQLGLSPAMRAELQV